MRNHILESLYELSKRPYQRFFKQNEAWPYSTKDLLRFKEDSLGYHLGRFLVKHHFELQPKLENHDVFHVLTNTGVTVSEEISMQFFLWGNGKRSAYLFAVLVFGTALYPDYWVLFAKSYRCGRKALSFHQLHFAKLLHFPLARIKSTFLIP